jgi:hypothetical protein
MREILTWFLPIYFLLFIGFAFLWRSWKTYRLTGVNPYRLMSNPGPEEVTSSYFRLLPLVSLSVLVVYLLNRLVLKLAVVVPVTCLRTGLALF